MILGNERPPAPQTGAWRRSYVPGVQLLYHHVMPVSLLREIWNYLVEQAQGTQSASAHTALRQFLALYATRTLPDLEPLVAGVIQNRTDNINGARIHTAIVWAPWNIVEGPANRADDPGDHYLDRFTHGLTRHEALRMRRIEELYHDFQDFLASRSFQALTLAVIAARMDLLCDGPIPFRRAEMWEEIGTGMWQKRRSGEQIIPG